MKKKILMITLILTMFSGGYALATSVNEWNGFTKFNLKSNGKTLNGFDSEGQPIIIKNHAYVPLYMLRQAGFQVTWDDSTRSVDVSDPSPLSDARISEISKSVGLVEVYQDDKYIERGTGFMIPNNIFVTNCHVGCAGNILKITLDGKVYKTNGEYLFKNDKTDVFGVKIDVSTSIPISNEPARIGTHVLAIGYPHGEYKITRDWVGAITKIDGTLRLGTTNMLDDGSSGSPILNEYGEVVGVGTGHYEGMTVDVSTPFSYVQDELNKIK